MLRNFLYLNGTALDGYLSAVEDGSRTEVEQEESSSRDRDLEASAKVVKGSQATSKGSTARTRGVDTVEAKFSRLMAIADVSPDDLGWVDVVNPNVDLVDIGHGAMVSGEADFYVPTMIRNLSGGGQDMGAALDLLEQFEPLAGVFNLDMEGLPSKQERAAVKAGLGALKSELVAVGELDSSDWKVAGQLSSEHLRAEVDGYARFVGKVAKQWPSGEGRHLLALPGTTLLPREKRRELERQRPAAPDDDSYLDGPALMLDLLAVWR